MFACHAVQNTNAAVCPHGRFWRAKIQRNRQRDLGVNRELRKQSWVVLRIWECQLQDGAKISLRIQKALGKVEN
jgi:DNA mismatch endonuclease (patch repair protein)